MCRFTHNWTVFTVAGTGGACARDLIRVLHPLINKSLEPSSNYLSPSGIELRSLSHGIPHNACGYPHVATVTVAWGG